MTAGGPLPEDAVESFLGDHTMLDEKAADWLRKQPESIQAAVLERGSM